MSADAVAAALATDPAGVLGAVRASDGNGFIAHVAVDIGGGAELGVTVHLEFGRLPDEGAVRRYGLSWSAAEHDSLFPRFGGDLEVYPWETGAVLRLAGYYRPPLGAVGAFGDGVVGHRVARRAIEGFLTRVAERLHEVRVPELVTAAITGDVDVREAETQTTVSEIWLG